MSRVLSISAILVVVVGFAVIGLPYVLRGDPVSQPIAFNHVVHLESAGMQCVECHRNATTNAYAGIPSKTICLDCHDIDEEQNTNPQKDVLFSFDDLDEDIPWQRVTRTRIDVYFSHRRHVTSGKIDCLECHRDQTTLLTPPRYNRLVMRMGDCLACHEDRRVSTDCLICHR